MTHEQLRALVTIAVQIGMEAPERFDPYGSTTYVRRKLIAEIRALCDAAGIDWRVIHKAQRAERAAARNAARGVQS